MRGSTVKKLKKFAKILIANDPDKQKMHNKGELAVHTLTNELKIRWRKGGKKMHKFVHLAIAGNFE
jgi:hypothetical protein